MPEREHEQAARPVRMRPERRRQVVGALVCTTAFLVAVVAGRTATAPQADAAPLAAPSRFVPMTPFRLLDTRTGLRAVVGPVEVGGTRTLGLPQWWAATAVALNVTVADATGPGYVQAFPTGRAAIGDSSSLNIGQPGETRAGSVVVPVGDGAQVSFYLQGGGHLIVDIFGFFTSEPIADAGRFVTVAPQRILDTRSGLGQEPPVPQGAYVPPGGSVRVRVAGNGQLPATGIGAVVVNLTATEAAPGYVQVYPTGGAETGAFSNLNVSRPGQTIANLVVVPIGEDGTVSLYTERGAHLIVDVQGYFTRTTAPDATEGLFVPLRPARVLDTRNAVGAPRGPLAATSGHTVEVCGRGDVPARGAAALIVTLTATEATNPGFVQLYPTGASTAGATSNLNANQAGETLANAVFAPLSASGSVTVYSEAGTHALVDVAGYFTGSTLLCRTTITFDDGYPDGTPFTIRTDGPFTVRRSGAYWVWNSYGNPGPSLRFGSSLALTMTGVIVIDAGGATFSFTSVDVYSSMTAIPVSVRGIRPGVTVFQTETTVPHTSGRFATVSGAQPSALIETLVIQLTNPPSPGNPMGVDNIVLTR
jgi:hypothetical protein